MLKVGITGGIGSGKSTICQVFKTLGIPVFKADDAAKYLMEHDATLIQNIKSLLGNEVYANGRLNRALVSDIIYKHPLKLQELNALVHPATITYGQQWMNSRPAPYVIKEAAILFESDSNKDVDVIIGVYAPKELRISRVAQRSSLTREKVLEIMARQMNEEEKMKLCDYVITNDEAKAVLPQVLALHEMLLARVRDSK